MPIKNITIGSTGLSGVTPRIVYIDTNDTVAQVTATGYLNQSVQNGYSFSESDMCLVTTKLTPNATSTAVGWLEVSYVSPNWSLVASSGPGNVTLPTTVAHIATFSNVTGGLTEDPAIAISEGSIQAGASGTAGSFISYPATANNGQLMLSATAAGGAFTTTLTNSVMTQSTVYSLPPIAAATAGVVVSTSPIRTKYGIQVANAGGASSVVITDAFCTTASGVIAVFSSQTSESSIEKIQASDGSFTLLCSADPGACNINYQIFN